MIEYLTNIPIEVADKGISKVLLVRREIIHIKHIWTEVFIRKTIDIEPTLKMLGMDMFRYMEIMTQQMRRIHKITREFREDPNKVVSFDYKSFFPQIEFFKDFTTLLVLDFDGVITTNFFRNSGFYDRCLNSTRTVVCTANPEVTEQRFEKLGIRAPRRIYANKGKVKKLRTLIDLAERKEFTFYVDDEPMYLAVAWLFGIKTFQYQDKKIKAFTLNTR